jgi:hypothetical protein
MTHLAEGGAGIDRGSNVNSQPDKDYFTELRKTNTASRKQEKQRKVQESVILLCQAWRQYWSLQGADGERGAIDSSGSALA